MLNSRSIIILLIVVLNSFIAYICIKREFNEKSEIKNAYYRLRLKDSTNSPKVGSKDKKKMAKYVGFFFACLFIADCIAGSILVAILFAVIATVALFWYFKITNKKTDRENFEKDFRETLISMSNSMKAGSSLQNALIKAHEELMMQPDKCEARMTKELMRMIGELKLGSSITEVLLFFKERNKNEEVYNFVNAAVITERCGGDLSEVMTKVCDMISDKIEMKGEIESLTAGKRSESKILSIAPLAFLPIMAFAAPSYLEPMYSTLLGKILMVIAVCLLVINYILAKKITDIKI